MTSISWKTGSTGLWTDASDWSSETVPGSSDSVTISVAPATSGTPYTVGIDLNAVSVDSITLDQAEAELYVDETVLTIGTTFALTAGTLEIYFATLTVGTSFTLSSGGTLDLSEALLQGGTYSSTAGTVLLDNASDSTFKSLAWNGALNLTSAGYDSSATLNGVTFAGSGGTGVGTLAIGASVTTYVEQASLSNVHITLSGGSELYAKPSSATFTLTAGDTLSTTGSATTGTLNDSGGTLSNAGTINDASGEFLAIEASVLANSGTISVSNGATVDIATTGTGTSTNTGLLSVGAGSTLELNNDSTGGFSSSGSVSVAGTLALGGTLTTAQAAKFTVATGTLAVLGTINNAGATLTTGSSTLANLWLDGGEISGGKIVAAKDFVSAGGTLSGVTLDGTLTVSTPSSGFGEATLDVTGSLTTAGTAGTGAGTLLLNGAVAQFATSTTLTNLAITFGGTSGYQNTIEAGTESETSGTTLTLGSGVQVTSSGGDLVVATANDAIVNRGTITAGVQYGQFSANGLTNDGLISITNENTFDWTPNDYSSATSLVNAGTLSLNNGYLYLGYSGTEYTLDNTGLITLTGSSTQFGYEDAIQLVNSGTLQVSGGASVDLGGDGGTWSNSGTFLLSGGTVSLGGTFTVAQIGKVVISNGGALDIAGTLTNSGTLAIGTGTSLTALSLTDTGEIVGGTINDVGGGLIADGGTLSGVTYHGTITINAEDASLDITGGLTMAGTSGSGAGTILVGEFDTIVSAGSQTFNDTVIDIGTAGSSDYGENIQFSDASATASTLTLASTSSLIDGGNAEISGNTTYTGTTSVPLGDTLVNGGSITETSSVGSFSIYTANLLNTGNITIGNGSTFEVDGGTLTNQGTIVISGTGTTASSGTYLAGLRFLQYDVGSAFVNKALVTLAAGGQLNLDSSDLTWSNSGTFNVAGGQVDFGGTFTTAQLGKITVSAGGFVSVDSDGTLNNTNATLTLGGSSALGTVSLAGTIHGGTIIDDGNGITFEPGYSSNGTSTIGDLDNVQYDGVLSIASTGETASITGGLRITGLNGSGHGSIALSGSGAILDFANTETLADANVSIGNASSASTLTGLALTIAGTTDITQTGAYATLGSEFYNDVSGIYTYYAASSIANAGTILGAVAGGSLELAGDIANSGKIAVSNGDTLFLDTSALTNTGTISVTNGLLDIVYATSSQLTEVTLINSQLAVTGTISNTGSTLTVGTGTALPFIELDGTILGGTISDAGGGIGIFGYAALDNVTYEGTLELNRPLSELTILGSFTATGAAGTGAGSIAITGAGSQLDWNSPQSLNNATISIGNPGESYEGTSISAPAIVSGDYFYYNNYDYTSLSLGSQLTINQTGTYADIGGYSEGTGYIFTGGDTVTSAATINAGFAGGNLSLEGANFTNSGTIAIGKTDTITEGAASFTNTGLITIGAGSTLDLNLYNYFNDAILAPESFTNSGRLSLAGGTITEPTDNGTFPSVPFLNTATISGFGSIASALVNDGTITAAGGTLTIGQAVTGTGALAVDNGATLSLAAISSGETASFSGVGGILGLTPATFLGDIGGFASGDTIDLASTSATAASFSGTSLVVTLSTGGTIKLTTTTALSGALKATAGTHGDTLITFASAGTHKPGIPLPIAPAPANSEPDYAAGALDVQHPLDALVPHLSH